MGIADYCRMALRHWRVIVAGLLLGIMAGGGAVMVTPVAYTSEVQVAVTVGTGTSAGDASQAANAWSSAGVSWATSTYPAAPSPARDSASG